MRDCFGGGYYREPGGFFLSPLSMFLLAFCAAVPSSAVPAQKHGKTKRDARATRVDVESEWNSLTDGTECALIFLNRRPGAEPTAQSVRASASAHEPGCALCVGRDLGRVAIRVDLHGI